MTQPHRRSFVVLALVVIASAVLAAPASAATFLDQQQPHAVIQTFVGEAAQTFHAGVTGKLVMLDLPLCTTVPSQEFVVIAIHPTVNHLPAGGALASQVLTANQLGPCYQFQTFTFSQGALVTAGQEYAIWVSGPFANLYWAGAGNFLWDAYVPGIGLQQGANGWKPVSGASHFDFGFRTYVCAPISTC